MSKPFFHLDLFSGIGGFSLAAQTVWGSDYRCVGFCEIDPFCQQVLRKNFKGVRIYGDIRGLTAERLAADTAGQGLEGKEQESELSERQQSMRHDGARVDLLTGGFPCQPFSTAGKRKGTADNRFLWPEMFRIIRTTHPRWVIGENVAGIIEMALGQVCADLEGLGYEVQCFVIPACAVNAPHRRDRVWIVARRVDTDTECLDRRAVGQGHDKSERATVGQSAKDGDCNASDTTGMVVSARPRDGAETSPDSQTQWDALGNESGVLGESADANAREGRRTIANSPVIGQQRQGKSEQSCNPEKGGNGEATEPLNGGELRFPDWSRDWREVAFESCVRGVDDGLPRRVAVLPNGERISESKWRQEALKAYGNAIVPQVAMEIMRAIQEVDHE